MYSSIHQLVEELTAKIFKKIELGDIKDLDSLASEVLTDCKMTARDIIQAYIQWMNEEIRSDKAARKTKGLVLKEKDLPRTILTELGAISFHRDYYLDKTSGHHCSVLDRMLGIEKYERIGASVSAALVSQATDCSFAKATNIVTGGAVSRQTVHNHILRMHVPDMPVEQDRKPVPVLHVYADEDHVSMQKPGKEKGKKNKIVPLVTVTEGTCEKSKGRNATMHPRHFVDEEFDAKNLWKTVEGYIEKAYDLEEMKVVYVHGDGGSWIRSGLENIPQTKMVMDGYHFHKALKRIDRMLPTRKVRTAIISALKKNDSLRADAYIQELLRMPLTKKEAEQLQKFAGYLFRFWDAIRRRIVEDIPGSCTEGQISHVLSERFSRDPQGWSEACLGKLAKARVYQKNGGKLTKEVFRTKEKKEETYSEYADRIVEEIFQKHYDFSLFEPTPPVFDTASGTQILLSGIGKLHSSLIH